MSNCTVHILNPKMPWPIEQILESEQGTRIMADWLELRGVRYTRPDGSAASLQELEIDDMRTAIRFLCAELRKKGGGR